MRVVSLALFICLWCFLQGPAVLAGTRATLEESARINGELCRGGDGNWYPAGAKQCQPLEADRQPAATTKAADPKNETESARASETPWWPRYVLFLAAVVSLVAIAIAAIFRSSQRASKATSKPEVQPPDTAAQRPSGPWMIQPQPLPVAGESLSPPPSIPPTPPVLAEHTPPLAVTSAPTPTSAEPAGIHDQPAPAEEKARLINAWTGPSCTLEFTYQDLDGERQRRKVGVTRISRDPKNNGWHLHGFCHLEQRERDFEADAIVTKVLYKSRRWDLEDWITTVAGEQVRDS